MPQVSFLISLDGVCTFCIPFKSVTDSGFPQRRGGVNPCVWGENLLFGKIFAENCTKMKEIGLRGGTRCWRPPGPASEFNFPQKLYTLPCSVKLFFQLITAKQSLQNSVYTSERDVSVRAPVSFISILLHAPPAQRFVRSTCNVCVIVILSLVEIILRFLTDVVHQSERVNFYRPQQ